MLIGIDVSKYNLGWSPDKAKKPIGFVIQRASYGIVKDQNFNAILPEVQKIPIRGAYHYYSSSVNWKLQADLFLSIIGDAKFHFYVLDYEGAYNNLDGRTIAEAAEFVRYVKQKTNKRCMIYFNCDIYKRFVVPYGYTNWSNLQDVWIAQYPYSIGQTPLATAPALPVGLKKWDIWQYGAADVNFTAGKTAGPDYGGGLGGMDLNYFNGSIDDMLAWASSDGQVTIPPAIIGKPATVLVDNLNVRSGPSTTYPVVSVLVKYNKINISTESIDTAGNIWGKFGENKWCCMVYRTNMWVKYDEQILTEFPAKYRIKDDVERGVPPRPYRNGLPSTVRIRGGVGFVMLTNEWIDYVHSVNSDAGNKYQFSSRYVMKPAVGWHNTGAGNRVEQLTFSGNIVEVTKIVGGKAYIKSFYNSLPAPRLPITPFEKSLHPLVQLFTTQYKTKLDMSTDGRYPRTLIIANPGEELWIDEAELVRL